MPIEKDSWLVTTDSWLVEAMNKSGKMMSVLLNRLASVSKPVKSSELKILLSAASGKPV